MIDGYSYYVYVLASKQNGTLYTGVTGDLFGRVSQHKNDSVDGFTKKYGVHTLVYYEEYDNIEAAIIREKRIKEWKRKWKIELIEKYNPHWIDLYNNFLDPDPISGMGQAFIGMTTLTRVMSCEL
jgi:putative endonuclease